ncbi:MAG: hypothetical protein WD070_06015 [Pirellulaceae bacterium]
MLVSIRKGMFLEPLSRIVANEVVGAEKRNLSMEKVGSMAKGETIMEGGRVSENGSCGE